jgi:ribosomal protein S27AE
LNAEGESDPKEPDPAAACAEEPRYPERVCPTCGSVLLEHKCKLICPKPACGYYMSCADFY